MEKIRFENPGVPCFLYGHSTGGSVVLKVNIYIDIYVYVYLCVCERERERILCILLCLCTIVS